MLNNSVTLHRVFISSPDKIYKAFLDPDALSKFLPPNGFTGKVHSLDAKVGGSYKMSLCDIPCQAADIMSAREPTNK